MNMRLSIIILMLCAVGAEASTAGKIRAGNRHYKKGQFDKAASCYREAQITAPGNPYINYNIGNALYKSESFEEASAEYNKALAATDPVQKGRAYYNLGNTAYRQGKTDEALDFYKKALEANPRDMDAKYNIEFISVAKKSQDKQNKNGKNKQDDKNKGAGKGGTPKPTDKKSGMSKEDAQRILQYYNEADKEAAKKRKMQKAAPPKTDEDW